MSDCENIILTEMREMLNQQQRHVQDLRELRAIDWHNLKQAQTQIKELEAELAKGADLFMEQCNLNVELMDKVKELEAQLAETNQGP